MVAVPLLVSFELLLCCFLATLEGGRNCWALNPTSFIIELVKKGTVFWFGGNDVEQLPYVSEIGR